MIDQRPIYAVADVHGRADLLEAIIAHAEDDAARRGREPRIVFLGDIVDRGPESRRALDLVIGTLCRHPGSVQILGNHDMWFLCGASLEEPFPDETSWLRHGGVETLLSYSDEPWPSYVTRSRIDALRQFVREHHADHVEALRNASLFHDEGRMLFVHAGIRPGVSEQEPMDFFWIRQEFLEHVGPLPRVVVHGHTIIGETPIVTENRISLDTGAYASGRLSLLVVDPVERSLSFRQTDGGPGRVVEIEPKLLDRGLGTVLDDVPALFEPIPTPMPA